MPFKYSCFISYRRTNQTIVDRFVRDLKEALSTELAPLFDLGVFADDSLLVTGESFEQATANALCRSVAMIMVFTPTYFSESYPYCAREFKAMEQLEERRLHMLGPSDRGFGLIYPVVLRGADYLPRELQNRTYFDFSRFMVGDTKIYRSPRFSQQIRGIAESIFGVYQRFQRAGEDALLDCDSFRLPTNEEVMPWLQSITARGTSFPARKNS